MPETTELTLKLTMQNLADPQIRALLAQLGLTDKQINQVQRDAAKLGREFEMTVARGAEKTSASLKRTGTAAQELTAKTSGLTRGLAALGFSWQGMLASLAAGGAVYGLKRAIGEVESFGMMVWRVKAIMGSTAPEAAGLVDALDDLGIEATQVARAVFFMQRNIAANSSVVKTALRDMGLDIGKLDSAPARFWAIVQALAAMDNEMKRAQYSQAIFGRGAINLQQILEMSREQLEELGKPGGVLAGVFTDEQTENVKRYHIAVQQLHDAFLALKTQALGPLLPYLSRFMDLLREGPIGPIVGPTEEGRHRFLWPAPPQPMPGTIAGLPPALTPGQRAIFEQSLAESKRMMAEGERGITLAVQAERDKRIVTLKAQLQKEGLDLATSLRFKEERERIYADYASKTARQIADYREKIRNEEIEKAAAGDARYMALLTGRANYQRVLFDQMKVLAEREGYVADPKAYIESLRPILQANLRKAERTGITEKQRLDALIAAEEISTLMTEKREAAKARGAELDKERNKWANELAEKSLAAAQDELSLVEKRASLEQQILSLREQAAGEARATWEAWITGEAATIREIGEMRQWLQTPAGGRRALEFEQSLARRLQELREAGRTPAYIKEYEDVTRSKFAVEQQEAAAQEVQRVWDNARTRIEDMFVNTFLNLRKEGLSAFEALGQGLLDMMLADWLRQKLGPVINEIALMTPEARGITLASEQAAPLFKAAIIEGAQAGALAFGGGIGTAAGAGGAATAAGFGALMALPTKERTAIAAKAPQGADTRRAQMLLQMSKWQAGAQVLGQLGIGGGMMEDISGGLGMGASVAALTANPYAIGAGFLLGFLGSRSRRRAQNEAQKRWMRQFLNTPEGFEIQAYLYNLSRAAQSSAGVLIGRQTIILQTALGTLPNRKAISEVGRQVWRTVNRQAEFQALTARATVG